MYRYGDHRDLHSSPTRRSTDLSVQPTPALYLSNLGWDEGVAEFDRREGPGRADVERIFGQAPTCYGQPGSSRSEEHTSELQSRASLVFPALLATRRRDEVYNHL